MYDWWLHHFILWNLKAFVMRLGQINKSINVIVQFFVDVQINASQNRLILLISNSSLQNE
jgi:hypothetical protein